MELARTINRVFYIPIRFCSILTVMSHVCLPLLLFLFSLFCPLESRIQIGPPHTRPVHSSPISEQALVTAVTPSLALSLRAFIVVLTFPSSPSQKLVCGLKSLTPKPHDFQRTHRYLARYNCFPVYLLSYHTLAFLWSNIYGVLGCSPT